jgi:Zn-dependent protease
MLLGSPENTAYDLRFRLLDIPVRVHPLFWLVMVLISGQPNSLKGAAVFVACAFISVLVHEMGHGLSSRATGSEPVGIVLYAMGGYCQFIPRAQTPTQRLFVLFMGPGAGFLLMAVVLAVGNAMYGIHPADALAIFGVGHGDPLAALLHLPAAPVLRMAFLDFVEINFWWGVLNLMPIWPLDGGQASGVILGVVNPRHGNRWGHVLSLVTAGGIAAWMFSQHQYMMALWFGYFGFINYQILQTLQSSYRFTDDTEWWR